MRVYFDASVLVPAVVDVLEDHEEAAREVARVHSGEFTGIVAAHGLAETWSVATGLPVRPPISTDHVRRFLREAVMARFEVVPMDADDYGTVIDEAVKAGLRGRVLYDLFHVRAARAAGAERILTYNLRDFRRIAPDLAGRIQTP